MNKVDAPLTPVPSLEDKNFFLLNILLRQFRSCAQKEFLTELDTTLEMNTILMSIQYLGSPTQQQIADAVCGERSTIKRTIDNLICRGLVSASKDEKNKKVKLIRLTRAGEDLLELTVNHIVELEQGYLNKITAKETKELLRITRKLIIKNRKES